jgi:maltose/moltooligosaccharide transporter
VCPFYTNSVFIYTFHHNLEYATEASTEFWQIFNMSFGFLGIQFGWSLQMGNMGPIYEYLHVDESNFAYLFSAGPLTGLLVQPIIGYLSDHTWSPRWGRRRPFFLMGAILSSLCLVVMPNSSAVWMAAGTGDGFSTHLSISAWSLSGLL